MNVQLTIIPPGVAREAWVEMLEVADEPAPVRRYLQLGELFGVTDRTGGPRAAVLVIDLGNDARELRAVAVGPSEQGRGLGTALVAAVVERLRAGGATRVVVGTASSGTRQLAFYQRLGFRLTHIERDFFTEANGYPPGLEENGLPVRDMVWMDMLL